MNRLNGYDWLWVIFWLYFAIVEGIGLVHEYHTKNDNWTLTHFIAVIMPIGIRAAFLAWLAWHFLVQHKNF